jgi:hypothetical protein
MSIKGKDASTGGLQGAGTAIVVGGESLPPPPSRGMNRYHTLSLLDEAPSDMNVTTSLGMSGGHNYQQIVDGDVIILQPTLNNFNTMAPINTDIAIVTSTNENSLEY